MKILLKILVSLSLILAMNLVGAQATPNPPKKPISVSVHNDDGSSSSYSYSVSSSDDDGKNQTDNVSVSISNSDGSYSFNASFPKAKYKDILILMKKEMSNNNLKASNGRYSWSSESDRETVYNVNLNDKSLSMFLNKAIASESLSEKFEKLGLSLRTIIVGQQDERNREAERIQREADRLRRDAERMQREAERMKRAAERLQQNNASRYKEDAERIAEHARRIAEEAVNMSTEASHHGGVSDVVRTLLKEHRTYLSNDTESGNGWFWPEAQDELLSVLLAEDLIVSKNDVNFVSDPFGTFVNGTKVSSLQADKYKSIVSKYGISEECDYSLYKADKNVVIIENNPNVEEFLEQAVRKGLLASTDKKVVIEISGIAIHKDGTRVSSTDLETFNKLLLEYNIIPVPGKTLEILNKGGYKLGYSLGNSGHIGTWSMAH